MKRIKAVRGCGGTGLTFYTALSTSSVGYDTFKEHVRRRMEMLRGEGGLCSGHAEMSGEEDVLSHFACRMACSQDPWMAVWFVNAEVGLLRLRISKSPGDARAFFLEEVLPRMEPVEVREGALVLGAASRYNPDAAVGRMSSEIWVHFTKVIDLVGRRAAVPRDGYLRLGEEGIRSVLANEFRAYLSRRMDELVDVCSGDPDERMKGLSASLLASPVRCEKAGDFSVGDAEKYFPLCIQAVVERLRSRGHLKYNDRQILCLFLKDCGMSVDGAVAFFRSSFKADRETFDREYLYSIRHNYGLEGKRANYSCFTCSRIAGTTSGERRSSCPFVGDAEYVRRRGEEMGVDIEDVLGSGAFGGKCTRLLEALSHRKQERMVTTPVGYYLEYKGSDEGG